MFDLWTTPVRPGRIGRIVVHGEFGGFTAAVPECEIAGLSGETHATMRVRDEAEMFQRALLDGLQSTTHAPVAFGSAPASYVKTTLLALCELARARPARRATRGGALVADAETDALIAAAGVRPPDDRVARSVEARLRQPVLVAGDHVARHSAQVDGVGPRGHGDPLQRGGCGIGAHEMDGRTGASRQLEGVLHGLLRRRAIRRSLRRSRSCAEPTPAGASEMESKRDARCAQIDEAAVTSGGTRTS